MAINGNYSMQKAQLSKISQSASPSEITGTPQPSAQNNTGVKAVKVPAYAPAAATTYGAPVANTDDTDVTTSSGSGSPSVSSTEEPEIKSTEVEEKPSEAPPSEDEIEAKAKELAKEAIGREKNAIEANLKEWLDKNKDYVKSKAMSDAKAKTEHNFQSQPRIDGIRGPQDISNPKTNFEVLGTASHTISWDSTTLSAAGIKYAKSATGTITCTCNRAGGQCNFSKTATATMKDPSEVYEYFWQEATKELSKK